MGMLCSGCHEQAPCTKNKKAGIDSASLPRYLPENCPMDIYARRAGSPGGDQHINEGKGIVVAELGRTRNIQGDVQYVVLFCYGTILG